MNTPTGQNRREKTERPRAFRLDAQRFAEVAEANAAAYQAADPFPHIHLDGLFPAELLREAVKEIHELDGGRGREVYHTKRKSQFNPVNSSNLGPAISRLFEELNSHAFLRFLEKLTGIEGLIPDPYYLGGGVHETRRGGFLKVHADFNWHERLKLDRRVNVLLYLNENWQTKWGGQLELWSTDMKERRASIAPLFNRLAVFSTTDWSYHGHPDPLDCPENESRKSIALYYYTNGRPAHERAKGKHLNTLYKERPAEEFLPNRFRARVGKWIPPVVYRIRDFLRSR